MLKQKELKRRIGYLVDSINRHEEYLIHKKKQLEENPDSLAYQGMVKNNIEYVEELKEQLKEYEEQLKGMNNGNN